MNRLTAGLLFSLALSPLAWADPKLGVDVHKSSERVELRLTQDRPFESVSQKWRENPHRLEITVPKVEWQGKAVSNIDRGVLQKVEVKPGTGSVTVTLFALQNPKMSWISSADKKTWTLRISSNEMASSSEPPRLPGASGTPASTATAFSALPPVRSNPTPPRPNPRPVATNSNPTVPPTPPPARNNVDQRTISVSFNNKELASAIREMAQAAGLEAQIGPEVKGKPVTETFKDVPLSQALTRVLGRQSELFEVKFEGNRVRVFGDNSGGGATLMPTTNTQPSVPETASRPANIVSDYFPLKSDKSVREMAGAVQRLVSEVEVIQDERLNVLFVRGDAADLEKVRNLLQNALAK
ncbi:hypothetical protein JST97_36345 [bacterium]|nr:hypothetical protein [bacterium]